jgi:hypothetical protein
MLPEGHAYFAHNTASVTWGCQDKLENLGYPALRNETGTLQGNQSLRTGTPLVTKLKPGKGFYLRPSLPFAAASWQAQPLPAIPLEK